MKGGRFKENRDRAGSGLSGEGAAEGSAPVARSETFELL